MSKFASDHNLVEVDCGDGEWVKIPSVMSYADAESFVNSSVKNKYEQTLDMIEKFVKEWNFKDSKGELVPLSRDNIKRVDLAVIVKINEAIFDNLPDALKKKAVEAKNSLLNQDAVVPTDSELKKKAELESQS